MRRALVVTWLSGSATGVLLGLFGVQLVTSGITVGRVAPLSRPEVLSALRAAEVSEAPQAPVVPAPPPEPGPQIETESEAPLPDAVSEPAVRPPASPPPRPGAEAASVPSTVVLVPPATTPPPSPPVPVAPTPDPPAAVTPPPPPPPPPPAPPATTGTTQPPKKKRTRPDRSTTTTGPTTTTTRPAPPAKTAEPPTPAEPSEPAKPAEPPPGGQRPGATTNTISSTGGTVAVRYEDNRVRLLWARPNTGFNVRVENDGPWVVEVRFRSSNHRSRVYAFYKDGAPSHQVLEEGSGGDGDVKSQNFSSDGDDMSDRNWWRDHD